VDALRAALEQHDLDLAQGLAHSLMGVSITLGADKLASLAGQMENALIERDASQYAGWLQALETELAGVLAVM